MKAKNIKMGLIMLLSGFLVGCMDDQPRTLTGGFVGGVGGGVAGAGLAKAFGASNSAAVAIGLLGSAAGAGAGMMLGNKFDQKDKAKIAQAAQTGVETQWQTNSGVTYVARPYISNGQHRVQIYNLNSGALIDDIPANNIAPAPRMYQGYAQQPVTYQSWR